MDIDAYCLPDLPVESRPQPNSTQKKQKIDNRNRSKSAQQLQHTPIITKRSLTKNNFIQSSIDRQQFLQTHSEEKLELNVIENVIEQFVPHSDVGRIIKQRLCTNDKIMSTILP
ncbi:unnamed protein product, partial [Rotaria sp. Silwood1]